MADPREPPTTRGRAPPAPGAGAVQVVVRGRIARADIPVLCRRVRELLQASPAGVVLCDVGLVEPDAVAVDALARLQLTARRLGRQLRLVHACGELRALLAFVGLGEVLPCGAGSGLEVGGQAEQGEQAGGVEEEDDPGDPAA